MLIKFWGTRGSIPVPGKDTILFGGNTPCVQIKADDCYLILDGGTGIRELGNVIIKEKKFSNVNIIFSHYHWDHIQGIPFFKPLYSKDFKITFYGLSTDHYSVRELLSGQMHPQNFPVGIDEVGASVKFKNVIPGRKLKVGGLIIDTYVAYHPSPTIIYKFDFRGRKFIYMTDNELRHEQSRQSEGYQQLSKFCKGCDYLIHDSMFDEQSEMNSEGWGHSSNISLADFAIDAGVKNIILFHYNPDYSDRKLKEIYRETLKYFRSKNISINCIASRENLELEI